MPDNNISDEDYLDSLLRSVSGQKDEDFDIDKELGLDSELDEDFEEEFQKQLEAEFARNEDNTIDIKERKQDNVLPESNSVFSDADDKNPAEVISEESQNTEDIINNDVIMDNVNNNIDNNISNKSITNISTESENESVLNDITEGLEDIMGIKEEDKKTKSQVKEEIKVQKARIKANKKAAKEAAKIAKLAKKADRYKVSDVSMGDGIISHDTKKGIAGHDMDDEDYYNNAKTIEEKSIDNSVEEELAGLGLDGLFGEIGEEEPENNKEEQKSLYGFDNISGDEYKEDDDSDIDSAKETNNKQKNVKEKNKKEKKPKKKKEKTSKKKKEKKPKKEKKEKAPDEIINIPKTAIILGISFIVLLAVSLTIGGRYYNYNKHREKAVYYYVEKNYKAAYEELAGLDIKNEDKFFFTQIQIVMTVETNYDMFKSQMRLGMYREALDSLLKGVDNFDLYQNRAREWEAFDDLEISLRRIVSALNKYFNLTESQAREINLIESQRKYSIEVSKYASRVVYDKSQPFEDETTTESATETEDATSEVETT